ncbi:MAG TPA: ornithine cyclodeaminase family protein, partial [Candidatus Acidoferrales bacterium]|nr:ornithine cyclodeaminase family protein [Candidatus Acidoferrales bacterium]
DAFRRLGDRSAQFHSRQRLHLPGNSYLHYMAAADGTGGYMGMKIYTSSREGLRFLVPLFQAKTGELLALIEARYLGQMRTGAASGVATKLLARRDARTVGIIGTGLQAETQIEAVAAVRKIERVRAFGRDPERRQRFAREMSAKLGVPVEATASAEEAVHDADILITSTTASKPVVEGRWLRAGMHLNAIGANFPEKAELDADAVSRADVIFADSRDQSKLEAGDLIQAFEGDYSRWNEVKELSDLIAERVEGRTSPEQITLFKSNGIAIEDIVTAGRVYELALERGIGSNVELWKTESPD